MNKTININLGGLFFHIDEAAYQKLNRYLNSIRKSLSDDPQGQDEIIKDIELRISELLSDKIVDERQVVSETDIDDIVKIMGQPEDYNVDEEIFNDQQYTHKRRRTSKKLFRDGDDKFLGGVAAGTAHYLSIEPIWSRILWLVLAFGFGVGFFVYFILWILLPEARTTTEKLEMEGETVNIDNIEKKIREEFDQISDRVRQGANDVSGKIKDSAEDISGKISSADYQKYKTKAKSGLQEFLDTIGNILMTLLKIFGKFVGAIIIFIAAITLVSLLIGIFSLGSLGFLGIQEEFVDFSPQFFNATLPYWLIVTFTFISVAIPFFVLFMLGLRILSNNSKSLGKVTRLTLLAVWIISILGLIFTGIDISSRYNQSGHQTSQHDINIMPNDTLNISMLSNEKITGKSNFKFGRGKTKIISINNSKALFSSRVAVDIRKSSSENAYMKIIKSAHGRNYEDANRNSEQLEYQFKLDQKNLQLNNYFLNELPNGFYDQEIDVIIYLPEGQHVYLDQSTKYHLDDVGNVQNIYDRDMATHYYMMTKTELKCLDCNSDMYHNYEGDNLSLKIDDNSVQVKIKSEDGNAEINIDNSGVSIK